MGMNAFREFPQQKSQAVQRQAPIRSLILMCVVGGPQGGMGRQEKEKAAGLLFNESLALLRLGKNALAEEKLTSAIELNPRAEFFLYRGTARIKQYKKGNGSPECLEGAQKDLLEARALFGKRVPAEGGGPDFENAFGATCFLLATLEHTTTGAIAMLDEAQWHFVKALETGDADSRKVSYMNLIMVHTHAAAACETLSAETSKKTEQEQYFAAARLHERLAKEYSSRAIMIEKFQSGKLDVKN